MCRFCGVISPFITPFNDDLSIDFYAVRWLVDFQVERGVHGIFPFSTTGEFPHLSMDEGISVTRVVLDGVGGRVWVIPGISANCTEHSVYLGRVFMDMGVDGVIVTPPFFFKPSYDGLKRHFSIIAEKVDLPIIIYNIPSTTGVSVPVKLCLELALEYSNIVGVKATVDEFTYFKRLIGSVKGVRRDFTVLTGLDQLLLPVLMLGGDGGIMALANFAPQIHRAVYDSWVDGDLNRAYSEYKRLLKLTEIYDLASSFPSAVKSSLYALNTPIKPYVRPPLTCEPDEVIDGIRAILRELNLLGDQLL
ncbi:MAG: 4-hydroxy-tetrahydrodipicolinate synthase [Nitrososphaerota archaeon]